MSASSLEPRALRDAFGAFVTGVTVVTTCDKGGRPIGFTANSFTSVSLDPPLLLVCLAKSSFNYATMTEAAHFAVNILSQEQRDVSLTFARPVADRFATVEWERGEYGSPILAQVSAWFECALQEVIDAGDHVILLGRIVAFANSALTGLGYARGSYFQPALTGKAVLAAREGRTTLGAIVERDGEALLLGEKHLDLPSCENTDGDPIEALTQYLTTLTGLTVTVGFLYSVYEDRTSGGRHIVYLAAAGPGTPRVGRFLAPASVEAVAFRDKATFDVVARFGAESSIGQFGLYVGNDASGHVHSVPTTGSSR